MLFLFQRESFCLAPFIPFQGHARGVSTPPSAPPKLRPSRLPGLVTQRRSPGKSPVPSGGGVAHARAGQGGSEEEDLPEVDGRGGGGAAGSCRGNGGPGRLARRQAGQAVVSVPGTREAREPPLHGPRAPGPAAFSAFLSPPGGAAPRGCRVGGGRG